MKKSKRNPQNTPDPQKTVEPLEHSEQKTVEPLEHSEQNTVESLDHSDEARRLQEAAWPDMFANLQGAYAELVNTRFELERSSEQAAETRGLYQQMIASTSEAFFLTDLAGRVILTNPAAALLLECEEEAILNQELAVICGVSELPATPWQLTQRERGGRLENLEVEVTTFKGAYGPVSFNCTLMRDKQRKTTGVLAIAHDMRRIRALEHSDDARRLQEAAWPDMFANLQGAYAELVNTRFELERSSEQVAETRGLYQQFLASTSEAFFMTDLAGRVILTNPAAALLLECEEEAILNQELAAICGVSELPATPWELTQRERGGRLENLEVEVTTFKGARVPVSFNCTLMRDKQRKTTGVLAIAHDMRRIRPQRTGESLEHSDEARRLQEAAWPDMFANLQDAYAELVSTRFELERSSEQVAETHDLYQQIIASTSEAFFMTNLAGRVILTNPAAAQLLECEEEAILNQELAAICGASEVPATPWQLTQRERGGRLENLEVEVTTVNGARVPVSFNCTLMRDKKRKTTGVLAVAHDMRRIRALIENLIAARTRFEELFELAPEALALSDAEGRITLVNSQTENLFGYTREQLIGRNIEMLFPESVRNMLTAHTLEERTELSGLRRDCAEFPVEVIQRRIGVEGEPLTMSLINDITERKRVEQERELLAREQEARRVAEEDSRMKDDFLATISHELRTPLTAILGWTKILRAGDVDRASAERALVTIERNVHAQARLISDLLDASRIVTGKLRLEERTVDLRSLVEAAVEAIRPSIEAKRLRLQLAIEPWVGSLVGDPDRLKQALLNLLNNAIKFTPEQGLIEVRLEKLERKALLIVSDTGQGIDPNFLPYIFDRFRQADSSTKRSQGGLGLGLALVKYIVDAHNGAIYAYSRGPGQGSDFMITMPLAEVSQGGLADFWQVGGAEKLEPPAEAQAARRHNRSLQGVRALVVDDESDAREVLCAILNSFGADARGVSSAADGFDVLRQWRPHVLVSDIGMPVEDGYDLIKRVRALPAEEGGETPAIALTAFASPDDRERALSSGFQVHVGKPVEPVEMAGVVARLLGRGDHRIR